MSALDGGPAPSEMGIETGGEPDPITPDWSQGEQPRRVSGEAPEWLSPITERMEELSQNSSQMAQQLAALQQQPAEEEWSDEELSDEDYAAMDAELGPDLDAIERETYREAMEHTGDVFGRIREGMDAEAAEAAIEQRDEAFQILRENLPLSDQEWREVVNTGLQLAERWKAPELIGSPAFVTLLQQTAYAMIGRRARNAEQARAPAMPDGSYDPSRPVELGSASGAVPQEPTEPDWGARIVAAAQKLRPSI